MNTSKVKYGDATYTVRRATVGDVLARDVLERRLSQAAPVEHPVELGYRQVFCQIAAQLVEVKGGGVKFPTLASGDAELLDLWGAYLQADSQLAEVLVTALNKLDRPLNDAKGVPPDQLLPEQSNDPE